MFRDQEKLSVRMKRLTPYEALKCITEWSAYQHFEEDSKGTLESGKLADLVILDANPLKVKLDEIKEIIVSRDSKGRQNGIQKRNYF